MKKCLFIFAALLLQISLFAADAWETREEIEVNGVVSEKNVFVSDDVMKVINTNPNGETETIIDLKADKIVIITHNHKTFQNIKLSEYVKFAEQFANELKAQGRIDPEKVIPNVTFEKQGTETVGKWNCEVWNVAVDGKPYSKVWVAPELKNSPVIDFRKKFAAIMPESLAKYRTVEAKIEDNFNNTGMIVKSVKISQNVKMPTITSTVKTIVPSDIKKISFTIPAGYADKSAPAQSQQAK